ASTLGWLVVEKIILDCDPGHDDAIAILLAAGSPDIDLLAITTVAGNQTLEKVTRNAMSVCAAGGITVPIAAGSAGPLVRPQYVAEDIHGDSGLDGPALPPATLELDRRHAVDVIIDILMSEEPGTVHLVPTGPLTNIALAIRKEPRIVERVKSVVLMGGAYTRGNVTSAAEFNIYVDPEAAEAVFAADWDVTMVGLDLTHQATATPDVIERITAVGGPLATFVTDMLGFFRSTYLERFGFPDPPVHDACCVARLIDPAVFSTRDAFVAVELNGRWTSGMTYTVFDPEQSVPEVRAAAAVRRRTHVATTLDKDRFWDLVVDALSRLTHA
ncbi:MAG TPA: nucleoside hydrolase, partial [Propionibacteriaceae bacterium]|nr:nucleoside hydrolase [Propionibacteriaceae bacterium]